MSSGLPRVSVVVLNYNGIRFVEGCVGSVLASDYPSFEVIVVDNASTDGSYELLCDKFGGLPNLKLIRNERNLGFAEGNNVGYRQSSGEIVAFLNVDTRAEPSWIRELVEAMNSDGTIGAAQPKLMAMDEPEKLDSAGGHLDRLGYVYLYGEWYGARPHEGRPEPFYAEGAALAVKRKAVGEALIDGAPFDGEYFCYYEDSDLCWRLRLRGFRVAVAHRSIVYHARGYATREVPYDAAFQFARNHISTLLKNYDVANLFRYVPLLMAFELLRAASLLIREPWLALAKIRALLLCLKDLRKIWRKRSQVQNRIRKVPDSAIVGAMLKPNFASVLRSVVYRSSRP